MFLHFLLECLPSLAPGRRELFILRTLSVELVHQHAIGESAIGQKDFQHRFGHGWESKFLALKKRWWSKEVRPAHLLRTLANVSEWSKGVGRISGPTQMLCLRGTPPCEWRKIHTRSTTAMPCLDHSLTLVSDLRGCAGRMIPTFRKSRIARRHSHRPIVLKRVVIWRSYWRSFDHKMERFSSRKRYPKTLLPQELNNWSNHCFTFLFLIKGEIDWFGSLLFRNTCII